MVLPSIFNCSVGEARGFCCPNKVNDIEFLLTMQSPVLGSIAEIVRVTHRHSASTAVPIGGAGDGLTADMLACTVNDRKMGSVAVIFQHA